MQTLVYRNVSFLEFLYMKIKKSVVAKTNICTKGLDAIAFLSRFRVGGAVCGLMANEYRNTGINIHEK